MSIDVNSTDWLYELFGHVGPTWALILPAVGINSVSILGIFLNISVIFVSIKSRSLRGISNFLLAQISFYEVLHQLGHLLLLFLTLTGINFLPMFTAAMIMLPSVFGLNATMMALTAAALDRLFAVLSWNLRQKINKFLYLGIHVLICIFYGIYGTRDFFNFAVANPNLPKTGYMHDMQIDPSIQDRFTRDSLIQNILAISCYLLIWIAVKVKKEANQQTNARLLKSILVIVLMSISCYFVNMAIYQLAFTGTAYNDLRAWQMSFITGILLNVGAGSNAPILYITSSDYRKAFNEFLVPKCLVGRSMSSGSGGGEGKNWILTVKNKQIQPKRGMTTVETK